MAEAKGYRASVLGLAMDRLLAAGTIIISTIGRPSHAKQVLVLPDQSHLENGE
jgi:hypothetical protein